MTLITAKTLNRKRVFIMFFLGRNYAR